MCRSTKPRTRKQHYLHFLLLSNSHDSIRANRSTIANSDVCRPHEIIITGHPVTCCSMKSSLFESKCCRHKSYPALSSTVDVHAAFPVFKSTYVMTCSRMPSILLHALQYSKTVMLEMEETASCQCLKGYDDMPMTTSLLYQMYGTCSCTSPSCF